jgi:SAM-dependent methyltransferase
MCAMDNGWQSSADAWITDQGEHGDFGRQFVLDPIMLPRALACRPKVALDVGCGEGRFSRALRAHGVRAIGIDPTARLIDTARERDPQGEYIAAIAERLPFADHAFDLVVAYLSLIDIPDYRAAIAQMSRVLTPGGTLLIANLNSFVTACGDVGWIKDEQGSRHHYPVDHYLEERAMWVAWGDIRIVNYHRPLSAYMGALIDAGLRLIRLDEPSPSDVSPRGRAHDYRRVPWFLVMEWQKPHGDARPESSARAGD